MSAWLYRLAFAAARAWWFVRRPHTEGAVIAVWYEGRVLIVKTSYRRQYGLPGGFIKRGESSAEAAAREVAEELQLQIHPGDLKLGCRESTRFEHRYDTTTIWEITLDRLPAVHVDGREIVYAEWKTPAEATSLSLSPPVAIYFSRRLESPRMG